LKDVSPGNSKLKMHDQPFAAKVEAQPLKEVVVNLGKRERWE
jgi:hypothetical protein